jgi:CBS domain-containing protein/rhodanese-related sulfurtransferase
MADVERIEPEAAHRALARGALLVCAYENEDKGRAFRLEGALTLEELDGRHGHDHERELIFYCGSPGDEVALARAAEYRAAGFTRVRALAGGIEAWKAAGYHMAQPAHRDDVDHTPELAPLGPKPVGAAAELPPATEGGSDGASGAATRTSSGGEGTGSGTMTRRVSEVMTRNPEGIEAARSVQDAARRMRELDVGALPVRDQDGRFVGMITDRDITVRITAEGRDPARTKVEEAMSRDFVFCEEDADVAQVARLMQERQVRRIPIVKKGAGAVSPKELVGIISLGDLATDLQVEDIPARTLSEVSRDREG